MKALFRGSQPIFCVNFSLKMQRHLKMDDLLWMTVLVNIIIAMNFADKDLILHDSTLSIYVTYSCGKGSLLSKYT